MCLKCYSLNMCRRRCLFNCWISEELAESCKSEFAKVIIKRAVCTHVYGALCPTHAEAAPDGADQGILLVFGII